MDAPRFDDLSRLLFTAPSRRAVLHALAGLLPASALGYAAPAATVAKKGKSKKAKLKRNAFGCVDVGGKCRGKDSVCCSGFCAGKKRKKGKKDGSRCVAHDTGTGCVAGQVEPFCLSDQLRIRELSHEGEPNCTTSTGVTGVCNTSTGKAPFCTGDGVCVRCSKDTECVPFCGQGAVCAPCADGCPEEGTQCLGPSLTSCVH